MDKFLYLNDIKYIETWTHGGTVPLRLASSYRSQERRGTSTPDECKLTSCYVDPKKAWQVIGQLIEGASPDNCDVEDVLIIGDVATSLTDKFEDGLILCLSNSFDLEAHANRYPKDACVRITDIEHLKSTLDTLIGSTSVMDHCRYTTDHERSPFTKSDADSWQDEFRLYWKDVKEERSVTIPPGMAVEHWRRTTEPRPPIVGIDKVEKQAPPPTRTQNRGKISGITLLGPPSLTIHPPYPDQYRLVDFRIDSAKLLKSNATRHRRGSDHRRPGETH